MTTIQQISGITVKVTIDEDRVCPSHIKTEFKSLEAAVNYMKNNDVIHKAIRQGEKMVTLDMEKTDEANENWYENEMRLPNSSMPDLPTNMWK